MQKQEMFHENNTVERILHSVDISCKKFVIFVGGILLNFEIGKRISNKNTIFKLLIFNLSILFLVYALFLNFSFSSDTLAVYVLDKDIDIRGYLQGGRFTVYLIYFILNILVENYAMAQPIFQFINILCFGISATWITLIFSKVISKEKLLILNVAVLISFINPFIVDLYTFAGIEWGVGILLIIISIDQFTRGKYMGSSISLFLGVSTYQSYISIFLIYSICYIFLSNSYRFSKTTFISFIRILFMAASIGVLNISSTRILFFFRQVEKIGKPVQVPTTTLLDRTFLILRQNYRILLNAFGMLPKGLLIYCIIVMIGLVIINIFWVTNNIMDKVQQSIYTLVVILFMEISAFLIGFIMDTSILYFPARVIFPVFVFLSCLFIIALNIINVENIFKVYLMALSLYCGICIYYTQTNIMDVFLTNAFDKNQVLMLAKSIENYERKTGIEVKQIYTKNTKWSYYDYIHMEYDYFTYNPKRCQDAHTIEYFTGEKYEVMKMDDETYNKLFANKAWNCFVPDEQLVYSGDKLYWVIY